MPEFRVASPNLNAHLSLRPGKNLITGSRAFERHFGPPTSLELDILGISAAIYAADIAVLRNEREQFSRRLDMTLPVINLRAFTSIREELTKCLYLLTNDYWNLSFEKAEGHEESDYKWHEDGKVTLMFSGGLDSAAQAVACREDGEQALLVSHDSGNAAVTTSIDSILEQLSKIPGPPVDYFAFRVRGQRHVDFPYPSTHEPSQRARSFLFAALGALVSRRAGSNKILMFAENGQMAIHLPLTAARLGAFSTRTAHPEVLASFQSIFSELLQVELLVQNPLLYQTKAEAVRNLCTNHKQVVKSSVSCWKASRVTGQSNHCGECIPCVVRRIALETNGYNASDWKRDIFIEDVADLPVDDAGKANLVELADFAVQFASKDAKSLPFSYPDLVSTHFDTAQAISMYKRFALEARQVISRYSQLSAVLL